MTLLRNIFLTAMLLTISAVGFAEPLQKRVNFTIDAPFILESGGQTLAPGRYVLYQINQNNPNLFALFEGDMTSAPVAMIHTVRIDYQSGSYPDEAEVFFQRDEERARQALPELKGWTIPGMDGWEVISVVE